MSRDNKSLRLHLNARDFSPHKTKMSAGCVGALLRVHVFFPQTGDCGKVTTDKKDNKNLPWQKND